MSQISGMNVNDGFSRIYSVNVGDVVSVGAYNNNYNNYQCYYIPPKFTQPLAPVVAGENPFLVTPDYANQEATSRVSTTGWTVEKPGFVTVNVITQGPSSQVYIYINDKVVISAFANLKTYTDNNGGIFPVVAGDIVRFTGGISGTYCYFIPPKFTMIPRPIAEYGFDESLVEKPVMVYDPIDGTSHQKRDVNGNLIYERSWKGYVAATAAGVACDTIMEPNFPGQPIEFHGRFYDGAYVSMPVPLSGIGFECAIYNNGDLHLVTKSPYARAANSGYAITVTYTR
jgi:hypothetical protein